MVSGMAKKECLLIFPEEDELAKQKIKEIQDAGPITWAECQERVQAGIRDWMALYNVEDLCKISPQRWRGLCKYIGRTIFEPLHGCRQTFRLDAGACPSTNKDAMDLDQLYKLYSYYTELCAGADKPCMTWDFRDFAAVPESTWDGLKKRVTSDGMGFLQKARLEEESSLVASGLGRKTDTTITAMYLNVKHGYSNPQPIKRVDEARAIEAASLPSLESS